MKNPTCSIALSALFTLSLLLFSHSSLAHSEKYISFSYQDGHNSHHYHPSYQNRVYVINRGSGLARKYFTYGYETRAYERAYEQRRARQLKRFYHREHRHYHIYDPYNDYYECPGY